ncbi:MAG: hypothetical protein JNL18_02505 [Planctomycetaceae bacterium]|nr:hypothetical protein [Planctomycetaceae bacterium]
MNDLLPTLRRRSVQRHLLMFLAALSAASAAASEYNEFLNGDLSGAVASPTAFQLQAGPNVLVASSSISDIDLVTVTVPDNHSLSTISIEFHEGPIRIFTAVEQGPSWTAGVGFDVDPSALLGWVDFPFNPEHSHTGLDILAEMALAPGSLGFAPPLGSGDFTFLFQSPSSVVPFAISFNVASESAGLSGDFNDDAIVNEMDLARWRQAFAADAGADGNGDGASDGSDFLIWQRGFGDATARINGSPVPEPATAPLIFATIVALGLRGARSRYRNPMHATGEAQSPNRNLHAA